MNALNRFLTWPRIFLCNVVWWLIILGCTATPIMVQAADGEEWSAYTDTSKGTYKCEGHLICAAKVEADSSCSEFDLATKNSKGWPLFYTISIITVDPQCSGTPEFQARGSHTSMGTKFDLGPQLTVAGTASKKFTSGDLRYIQVILTDDAACDAPGNDVAIVLCYER